VYHPRLRYTCVEVAQKTTAGTRGKRVRGRLIMIKVILVIKVINQRGKKRETRVLFFFSLSKGWMK